MSEIKGPRLIHPGDLASITDAPSAVDSFIATIKWLTVNATISADAAGLVVHALQAHREALEPALVANVHN